MKEQFGQWLTDAKSSTAHYVLDGKCLCGATVKKFGGPPSRKPVPGAGDAGAFITPLCIECVDLNVARWQKKGASANTVPSKPQKAFWWRQPRMRKK